MRTYVDDDTIADIGQLATFGVHVRFRDWTPNRSATIIRYTGEHAHRGTWLDIYKPDAPGVEHTRTILAHIWTLLVDPDAPWVPMSVDGLDFEMITIETKEQSHG